MAQMKDNNMECHTGCTADSGENKVTIREQKLKDSLITRLNRAEGQVRGIRGMIERDAYCNDVLNQISAVQAALDSVSKLVLENHIRGCLVEKIQAGDDKIVDELLVTIGKML
ncbi:MAG TPA: metal-sensitive transcriptional regulator [Anaerovoracaceae bacterium]|nr:metal-sensitive transcriptional regulator [Anaerovoracaceae bacterium]